MTKINFTDGEYAILCKNEKEQVLLLNFIQAHYHIFWKIEQIDDDGRLGCYKPSEFVPFYDDNAPKKLYICCGFYDKDEKDPYLFYSEHNSFKQKLPLDAPWMNTLIFSYKWLTCKEFINQ